MKHAKSFFVAITICAISLLGNVASYGQIALPANGIINTIAGTGTAGYSGDGGLATTATLRYPFAIAVDKSGNLYVLDTNNNVLRKVLASTGDISTIAGTNVAGYSGDGGAATSTKLSTDTTSQARQTPIFDSAMVPARPAKAA